MSKPVRPAIARVKVVLRMHRWLVIRLVATSLARSGMGLLTILMTRDFLAGALGASSDASVSLPASGAPSVGLWVAAALLLGSIIASSLLAYDNRITQQRVVQVLELDIMERLVRHLLTLSVSFFDKQSTGDLLQAVRQDVVALRSLVFSVAGIVLEATSAIGLFVAALWLSPRLTLWALILMPIATLPVLMASRRATRQSHAIRKTGYALFDALLEMLRGIRVVKVYRGEERVASTTMVKNRRYFDEALEMVRVQSNAQVLLEIIAGLGLVIVVVVGGLDVMAGRLLWPSLLAFLLAVRALYGPVNNINANIIGLGALRASTDRVSELLATESQVPQAEHPTTLVGGPAQISFEDVAFAYDDDTVLRDVSFTVARGETIGIAGPSGAGKSTLLNLVARFHDPTQGHVRFDDVDVRELSLESVYDHVAVVTQEPFLFATTIRENIRCARPLASDQDVEAAARDAGMHEEIMAFTNGYDTVVGMGGTGVSGGQAQRVSIARALLKNPPILLLDEATASLDSLSEHVVQSALERLMAGRTTFVVAHRLSTLRSATRILVLQNGSIVGIGPHAELLESCPLYAQMWAIQTMDSPKATPDRPPIVPSV